MILHLDMDAFFASVEQLDNPDLKGRCLVVGGSSKRGVVAAASYEARRHGIHSAMPMFKALPKCPEIVVVPPRRARYAEVSRKIMGFLETLSPKVEPVSIDEAFMDISGLTQLFGTPVELGRHIKHEIRNRFELTASVGIAPGRTFAKIASDMDKPDGLTVIMPEDVPQFIETLTVNKIPGVGKIMAQKLRVAGLATLGAVRLLDQATLTKKAGKFGERLYALSRGIDSTAVAVHQPAKSVSAEETFEKDTRDRKVLRRYLLKQAESVGRQLRKIGMFGNVVVIKMKDHRFKVTTRQTALSRPTQSAEVIYRTAVNLLERNFPAKPLRLIGVGAGNLTDQPQPRQMSIFEIHTPSEPSWESVGPVMDQIKAKYGKGAIKKGSLHKAPEQKRDSAPLTQPRTVPPTDVSPE